MDIDLNGLLVFRHLALSGSFTETGRRWKMSQPAVSLMISKLEGSVGLILLERSSSGARLTPAGVQFLKRANDVCDTYLSFIDGVRNLSRRLDHQVVVAMDTSWFSELIYNELQANPLNNILLQVIRSPVQQWDEALKSTHYDVVLAGRFLRAGISPDIQEAAIQHERGITVAWNPDFHPFDLQQFNFPEILRTTILIPDNNVVTGFADFLEMWCNYAYGIHPAHIVTFSTEEDAATAAAAGLGILLAPGDALPRLREKGQKLSHVRTFEFLLPEAYTYGVYCRSDEDSKEVLHAAAALGKIGKKLLSSLG